MIVSPIGEDRILICKKCKFQANVEKTGEIKTCRKCKSRLETKNCIEIGHIFNLGTKYSKAMKAEYLDESGKPHSAVMGCYGIGLPRLMATVVEIHNDKNGIIWPKEIAPFNVHLIRLENSQKVKKTAEKLYKELTGSDIEVLYDDRDKSPGEKFAEADLIGIPQRLVISERTLRENSAELKQRSKNKMKLIKLGQVKNYVENVK